MLCPQSNAQHKSFMVEAQEDQNIAIVADDWLREY
jgi:hypothetical protein